MSSPRVRQETALLRAFAIQAIDAGARAVLVIPCVPPTDAIAAIGTLARRLDARQVTGSKQELIRATNAVRVLLHARDRRRANRNGPTEAALDVTLFLREPDARDL